MSAPVRMCVACRARAEKSELMRVVMREGILIADDRQIAVGRGAYLCRNEVCIKKAVTKKLIARALKTEIKPEEYTAFWESTIGKN